MKHDVFGKLDYSEHYATWIADARLPLFSPYRVQGARAPLSEEDARREISKLSEAVENLKETVREQLGDQFTDQVETPANEPPKLTRHERIKQEKEAKLAAKRTAQEAKGPFPLSVECPPKGKPSPMQVAAFKFLREHEQLALDAVLAVVWECFQHFYNDVDWRDEIDLDPAQSVAELRSQYKITHLTVSERSRGGLSHLVFHLNADWADEESLYIVFSPDTRKADWGYRPDLYVLLGTDDPRFLPSPHDLLLEAILTNNETRAKELVAAGADINALGVEEYPPLWIAVNEMEVEEVRRLLAFGADPNLMNDDDETTALQRARKLVIEFGFDEATEKELAEEGLFEELMEAKGGRLAALKPILEEIIALLEAATGK